MAPAKEACRVDTKYRRAVLLVRVVVDEVSLGGLDLQEIEFSDSV